MSRRAYAVACADQEHSHGRSLACKTEMSYFLVLKHWTKNASLLLGRYTPKTIQSRLRCLGVPTTAILQGK